MERRQQPRKVVQHQVYFICVSADGRESAQDIGMIRDISPGGMLLVTTAPINTTELRIIAATADDQRVETSGSIIYSMQVGEGEFNTGIFFQSSSKEAARFVEQIMLANDENG
ncbi:MAG: hypothetical protein JRF32_00820 [Deltaproteobacteria bacterium]|nr:hypothetical protein [Deltaproteobacteria bacterium]MBW2175951.1 hypothetical protein [Deltaproteobacteria bacterium]MBW2296138.1 hypothetical protein [Deltaproteobacteria bacterium]